MESTTAASVLALPSSAVPVNWPGEGKTGYDIIVLTAMGAWVHGCMYRMWFV